MGSVTATSISLSWTSGGEGVNYELTWQRDTSLGCPDVENEGSTTFSTIIADGSSYDTDGSSYDTDGSSYGTDGSSYDTDDTDGSSYDTDGADRFSYDINGLEENSTYIITLTEFDAQGSNTYFIIAMTLEAGETE